jgi:hypothetical protein
MIWKIIQISLEMMGGFMKIMLSDFDAVRSGQYDWNIHWG